MLLMMTKALRYDWSSNFGAAYLFQKNRLKITLLMVVSMNE